MLNYKRNPMHNVTYNLPPEKTQPTRLIFHINKYIPYLAVVTDKQRAVARVNGRRAEITLFNAHGGVPSVGVLSSHNEVRWQASLPSSVCALV